MTAVGHGIRLPNAESGSGTALSGTRTWAVVRFESTEVEPLAFGFVEDIHVSSNACKDVQARANTGSVSDEKSKNVQAHANLSKDFAGSLLDGVAGNGEDGRSDRSLLSVRQVAKLLGMCTATIYRLCGRGELAHYRVRNAIRLDLTEVKAMLQRSRGSHH